MKKAALAVFALCSVCTLFAQEAVKKVWNDGTNDYVPLGTRVKLSAENLIEGSGTIYYTYNSGEPVEYTEPIALNEEGQVWISYATRDVFGHVSNHRTYTAFVDGTAPDPKYFVEGPSWIDGDVFYFTSNTGFLLYGEDNLSGTEHIYVTLSGSDQASDFAGSDFLYLTDSPDGEYTVEGYMVDYVGNASETVSAVGYLDNTAPEVTIAISPEPVELGGETWVDPAARFTISATDELSGVNAIYVSLNDSPFASYKFDSKLPISGTHSIKMYAVDNLGNRSEVKEVSFSNNLTLPPAEHELVLDTGL